MSGNSERKYMNSSDSIIYSKRNVLFGFYESLPALKEKKQIIICEGNFDVISLHQAGLDYSCATCGTALTPEHIKMIKRYCDKIYLLFDSDAAGQKATSKAVILCQQNDLPCFVMKIEGAKDASELLENQGAQAVLDCCVNSIPGFSYLVTSALKLYDIRQPKGKTDVLKEVKPYLDATASGIERQEYIRYLSERLRVSEDQLLSDYQRLSTNDEPRQQNPTPAIAVKYNPLKISTQLNAMLILLKRRDRFESFRNEIKPCDITDEAAKRLYTVLEDASRQEIRTNDMVLQMISDPELRNLAAEAFTSELFERMDVDKTLKDAVYQLKLAKLEEQRSAVQRMLSSGEMDLMDETEFADLIQRKSVLDKEILELKGEM